MTRHHVLLLTALALGALAGCSAYPPKVACEKHLTPINPVPPISAVAPSGAARTTSKDQRSGSATHGR
jgi:uncharacterized lipoprotein YajG